MRRVQGLTVAMVYILFTAAAAEATSSTYNATVNLNPNAPCTCPAGIVAGNAALPPVSFLMGLGDQITGTISLANGPVDLSGPAGSFFIIELQFDGIGTSFLANTSSQITLGNLAGSLPDQLFTSSGSSGTSIFADIEGDGSSPYHFSFSNFSYTTTVTSLSPTAAQVVRADYFEMFAGSIRLDSGVPEPGTGGLSALGCVALLGIIFGRRCKA